MTFDKKTYNKAWRLKTQMKKRKKKLLESNRCPVCEMKLDSRFHTDCPYNK